MERCEICDEPADRCTCCLGCGHVCPLDLGEPYCPVCKPESRNPMSGQGRKPAENPSPRAGDKGGKGPNIHLRG